MISYFNYLIEVSFVILILLVFYILVLQNETDFAFNRKYLITSLFIAIFLPLVKLTLQYSSFFTTTELLSYSLLPEISIMADGVHSGPQITISLLKTVELIYLLGVVLLVIRFIIRIAMLAQFSRQHTSYRSGKYTIVETNGDATFSFFNIIFIGKTDRLKTEDKELIVRHEMVHARELHSLDVLLLEMFTIALWFNPLLIFYKKILINLHEFQADEKAVESYDVHKYCNLLARVALMSADFTIANHFNNSLTSKRITMMKTIKKKISGWKLSLVLVTGVCLVIASCQEKHTTEEERKGENSKTANEIFTVVEESASPAGGYDSLIAFVGKNLKYPDESRKEGKEGKVFIEFVVNTDGSLSDFVIKKGVDTKLDEEALRVAKLLPLWNPGKQHGIAVRQQFILPISFKLAAESSQINRKTEIKEVASELHVTTGVSRLNDGTIVTGSVTSNTSSPLAGANIVLYGGSLGTSTDDNGNFKLAIPEQTGQLTVSFVGYKSTIISF